MKKPAFLLLIALTLAVASAHAQNAAPGIEITGSDQLVKEKGRFKETWVHPEVDFTGYTTLYLWVAELQFRDVEGNRVHTSGKITDTSEFPLSQEEQEKFRQTVTKTLVEELGRSKKFQLVDEIGPETLIVRASILDIVCRVPPHSGGQVDTYPSTVGEATLRFELIDPETGVMQARVEERSRILPSGRIRYEVSPTASYRMTMWRDVDQWGRRGASDLRRVLEKAQGGHRLK